MRIGDDLRKCVLFFGYPDATPGRGGINCIGTGFLLMYDSAGYLITARHLSHALGDNPFLLRVNKHDGTSENLHADQVEWFDHPDPTVDISMMMIWMGTGSGYDVTYLNGARLLLSDEQVASEFIGVGSLTYTVGLFRLLSGEKRNMPICHFGAIAMTPSDEKIPILDWTDPDRKRRIFVEGYLVESQSLSGLSGSPVFVRPEHNLDFKGVLNVAPEDKSVRDGEGLLFAGLKAQLRLLGIWQGSWEAPPDEVRAVQQGIAANVKIGVGMGVVVPCQKLIELLESPPVKQQRENFKEGNSLPAATPQSVRPVEIDAKGENPQHREDFNAVVSRAAKKN